MFLNPSDFIGKYELHTGLYDSAKLQMYIDKYEESYLKFLLGITLYNEFISDIDVITNLPKSPNFIKIYYPFSEDVNSFDILMSNGIIEMLKGFIYFEYSKDQFMSQTPYGGVQQTAENSRVLNTLQTLIYARYNEAVNTYQAIQTYLVLNSNVELGQVIDLTSGNTITGYYLASQVWTTDAILLNGSVKKWADIGIVGNGYPVGFQQNVPCSGGSGSGMEVSYTGNPLGVPLTIAMTSIGNGYQVGDIVTITGSTLQSRNLIITEVFPIGNSGTGLNLEITTYKQNGVKTSTLLNSGGGYTLGVFDLNGGSGTGAKVRILSLDNVGGGLTYSIEDEGTNYQPNETLYVINAGSGTFGITTTQVWVNSQIKSVEVGSNMGVNYVVGQQIAFNSSLGVFQTNQTANVSPKFQYYTISYVGKGKYGDFNGKDKRTAFWI